MRLIDAEELRAEVLSWENCYNGFSDTYDKAMIIDTIDEQPTIDAEPVRRGWRLPKGQNTTHLYERRTITDATPGNANTSTARRL